MSNVRSAWLDWSYEHGGSSREETAFDGGWNAAQNTKGYIMVDDMNQFSGNRIIGDLIAREKYSFIDGKLIASIVDDVMAIINDAMATNRKPPVISHE